MHRICRIFQYTMHALYYGAFRTVSLFIWHTPKKKCCRRRRQQFGGSIQMRYQRNVMLDFCLLHIKAFKAFFNFQFLFSSLVWFVFGATNVKSYLDFLWIDCDSWNRVELFVCCLQICCCPRNFINGKIAPIVNWVTEKQNNIWELSQSVSLCVT